MWAEREYEFWERQRGASRVRPGRFGGRDSILRAQERAIEPDGYLLPSRKGGHITKQRADQIIKETARSADLQRSVHAQLFRHGYAINFLNCGGRLDALQEQLGHRDINTTRIYPRLTSEDVIREVAKIEFY